MTGVLKAEDIKPKIGSRILNSKEELLSGEFSAEIRDLLEQRGVLVFPKINFNDEEQLAFTRTLGTVAKERSGEEVFPISLDPQSFLWGGLSERCLLLAL